MEVPFLRNSKFILYAPLNKKNTQLQKILLTSVMKHTHKKEKEKRRKKQNFFFIISDDIVVCKINVVLRDRIRDYFLICNEIHS